MESSPWPGYDAGIMMNLTELSRMLGLEKPWSIASHKINHETRQIVIEVKCDATVWMENGRRLHIHSWEERKWRHLNFWQYETILIARVPRVEQPFTGSTQIVQVPWAEKFSRFTKAFEAFAIEVLQCTKTLQDASKLLNMNWHALQTIMTRAVERGVSRREASPIEYIGIDEKSFLRGQNYITLITDIEGKRVLDVRAGADKATAKALITDTLNEKQRKAVKAVAMDRSGTFSAAVPEVLPQADIVFDPYHLAADLNKAVDQTRRQEHYRLMKEGKETLKGTRYLWLYDPENMTEDQATRFETLARRDLATARAWLHKELFKGLYEQKDRAAGSVFFDKWEKKGSRSRLPAIKKVTKSFSASKEGILNWFELQITNRLTEGMNSVIQSLKTAARGFRNEASYRTRILFYAGKLDVSM